MDNSTEHTAEEAVSGPLRPVSADYADGLRFAADVVHAEARWQTELAMRNVAARHEHRHAADRMSVVEDALRSMAECVAPPCHQCGPGYRIGSEGCHHNEEGSHA